MGIYASYPYISYQSTIWKGVEMSEPGDRMMTKCETYDFEHLWEDTTPNIVYATYPPSYPPKQRKCKNCGLEQTEKLIQREIREWQDQPPKSKKEGK